MKQAILAILILSGMSGCHSKSNAVANPVDGTSISTSTSSALIQPTKPPVDEEMAFPTSKQRLANCRKKILNEDDLHGALGPFCQGVAWSLAEQYLKEHGGSKWPQQQP